MGDQLDRVKFAGVFVGLAWAALAGAQGADDLVQRVTAATGGAANWGRIRSLRITGTLQNGDQPPAPITVFMKRPSLFHMELDLGGDHITQAYDGKTAWQMVTGEHAQAPAALEGAMAKKIIDQAVNAIGGPLHDAETRGNKVEVVDKLTLKITLSTGNVIIEHFDPATYLEQSEEILPAGGEPVIEERVGDWTQSGQVKFARRFESNLRGDATVYRFLIKTVEVNPLLDDAVFRLPGK